MFLWHSKCLCFGSLGLRYPFTWVEGDAHELFVRPFRRSPAFCRGPKVILGPVKRHLICFFPHGGFRERTWKFDVQLHGFTYSTPLTASQKAFGSDGPQVPWLSVARPKSKQETLKWPLFCLFCLEPPQKWYPRQKHGTHITCAPVVAGWSNQTRCVFCGNPATSGSKACPSRRTRM